MKSVIIYFSQTGSTEKVAKAIQAGIQQTTGQCDFVKIKDANPRRLYDYDLIGIGSRCPDVGLAACGLGDLNLGLHKGFPLGDKIPYNIELFINDLRFINGKHVFVFNTHAAIFEYFFPTIVPMLKEKGLNVIGWSDWYGNPYLPWNVDPFPTAGHPDEQDLKEAEEFGRQMVERSLRVSSGETQLIPPIPEMPPLMTPPDRPAWVMFHRYFQFHKEKCLYPECHLCVENCPVDGLDLSLQPPNYALPCQKDCAFCTMICPTGAIEIDEGLGTQIPAYLRLQKEIILPRFQRQEKEGKFRRLIPEKEIGSVAFADIYNGHPKWIIGKGLYRK